VLVVSGMIVVPIYIAKGKYDEDKAHIEEDALSKAFRSYLKKSKRKKRWEKIKKYFFKK